MRLGGSRLAGGWDMRLGRHLSVDCGLAIRNPSQLSQPLSIEGLLVIVVGTLRKGGSGRDDGTDWRSVDGDRSSQPSRPNLVPSQPLSSAYGSTCPRCRRDWTCEVGVEAKRRMASGQGVR